MDLTLFDYIAIAFWPLVALYVFLIWKNIKPLNAAPYYVSIPLTLGGVAVLLFLFIVLMDKTEIAIFIQYTVFIVFGIGLIAFITWSARHKANKQSRRMKLIGVTVLGVTGMFAILFFGLFLVGDFLYARREITGVVAEKLIKSGRWTSYHVTIDGKDHTATVQAYDRIAPNMKIRAKVGAASKTIFSAEIISD